MDKLKRRLFFWVLVIFFFITAPVVMLNARGYRFDMSRGVFVYSGTITLKTNPQDVDIHSNNELVTGKGSKINNSHNLTGLLPGDYELKISSTQYKSWSKHADVHSGVATEFWNVLLVRNFYEQSVFSDTEGVDKFYLSPQNDDRIFEEARAFLAPVTGR